MGLWPHPAARRDLGQAELSATLSPRGAWLLADPEIGTAMAAQVTGASDKSEVIYRHAGAVRVTHWINALVLLVLLMSGLQIFNAHPALYLGSKSDFDAPVLAMRPMMHDNKIYGVTTVLGWDFDTTGVFGLSRRCRPDTRLAAFRGGRRCRAIATSPWAGAGTSSSPGCFCLNGLVYLLWSLGSGHLAARPCAARPRAQAYRPLDLGPCAAQIPQGRRGQALQRAAEAQLSRLSRWCCCR